MSTSIFSGSMFWDEEPHNDIKRRRQTNLAVLICQAADFCADSSSEAQTCNIMSESDLLDAH